MQHCSIMCLSIIKTQVYLGKWAKCCSLLQQTLTETTMLWRVKPWQNPGSSCPLRASLMPSVSHLCHQLMQALAFLPTPPQSAELMKGILVLSLVLSCCLAQGAETQPVMSLDTSHRKTCHQRAKLVFQAWSETCTCQQDKNTAGK